MHTCQLSTSELLLLLFWLSIADIWVALEEQTGSNTGLGIRKPVTGLNSNPWVSCDLEKVILPFRAASFPLPFNWKALEEVLALRCLPLLDLKGAPWPHSLARGLPTPHSLT